MKAPLLLKQSLKKRAKNKLAKLGSSLKKQQLEKARTETTQFGFSQTTRILALLMSCSFTVVETCHAHFRLKHEEKKGNSQ